MDFYTVVRKNSIKRHNCFNNELEVLEDVEFCLHVAQYPFALIDAEVGLYRRFEDNLTGLNDLLSPITIRRQKSVSMFNKIKLNMCQTGEDLQVVSKEIAGTEYIIGQCCAEQGDLISARHAYLESLRYQPSIKSIKGFVSSFLPQSALSILKKLL